MLSSGFASLSLWISTACEHRAWSVTFWLTSTAHESLGDNQGRKIAENRLDPKWRDILWLHNQGILKSNTVLFNEGWKHLESTQGELQRWQINNVVARHNSYGTSYPQGVPTRPCASVKMNSLGETELTNTIVMKIVAGAWSYFW